MNRHIIRTSKTDSVKGLPSKQYIDLKLSQTTKNLPFPNINTIVNQREIYEEERQAGDKFRLILTIVPYCSNVLFNTLTEIIKDEGSNDPKVVTDCTNMGNTPNNLGKTIKIEDTYGVDKPTRTHMICNTEYSSEKHGGYEYHPGYDFFDNHILRNKTFKIVNKIENGNSNAKEVFNTLKDYIRNRDGQVQKYVKRISINSINEKQGFNDDKHLYIHDDILKIDESINQNLYEDNGWWGFLNNSTIDAKERDEKTKMWDTMDISRALNNHKSCEFIDMYPDKSLFSFVPKYNPFTNENENNWNVVVTYPYKNVYNHPLCFGGTSYIKRIANEEGDFVEKTISEGNRWMSLKVMSVKLGSGKAGGNNLIFRTYTKHGMSRQDMFYLYYTNPYIETEKYSENEKFSDKTLNGSEIYYESDTFHKVTNVGDLSRNDNDYYFYTSDLSLLKEIYHSYLRYVAKLLKGCDGDEDKAKETIPFYDDYKEDDKKDIYDEDNNIKITLLNKILKYSNFRLRRCVSGVKSTYYMRLFRKIPNLRAAEREMTDQEKLHRSKFNGDFEKFITDNALDPINPKYQRLLNNEQYKMAFAKNIFNDNVVQITFTDGVTTEGLTDNLGRPLTELYYTVVKNNAGHEAWYMEDEEVLKEPIYSTKKLDKKFLDKYGKDYTIEYSHCFGRLTSGFEMFFKKDDNEETTGPNDYLKKLSSAHHISNIVNIGDMSLDTPIEEDKISYNIDSDIKYNDTFFSGDLVEFNSVDFQERVLSHVMFRFNTAQRELINCPLYSQYQYHEITEDDYDPYDFEVKEYSAVNGKQDEEVDGDGKPKNITTDFSKKEILDYATIGRPEGYIYQAHYPIPIREYTNIIQDSHYTLRIKSAKPVQKNGILIQIKTKVPHKLNENDIIYICDDASDIRYITHCVKTIDKTTFLMSPNYSEIVSNATDLEDIKTISNFKEELYSEEINNDNVTKYKTRFSWLELCEILNGNYVDDLTYPTLVLRRKNYNIPDYAAYIGGNQYLWRGVINIGDSRIQNTPDYIFANGYFYITQTIRFYLKRQDPYGNNGLYFDGEKRFPYFPNDPAGIIQKENNFNIKDTDVIC